MTDTLPISEIADVIADPVEAATFPDHILRYQNLRAARTVGLDDLSDAAWVDHFGRFRPLDDNLSAPLALRYHGHQFGAYNPDLGDGRGFLFAQIKDDRQRWLDLGTKGSGRTPYSRTGDGRLTLKGGVREVLATTMLETLGVNTSKSFSLIETGEALMRGDEPSPTRSSVLVRLSHSHIRFGTFQRLAALDDRAGLERLVQHCVRHYSPDCALDGVDTVCALLQAITERTAAMVASWMAAGFVHGVMNTDNFNLTGESFDYGPYRFLPNSDPNFVAAYFDQQGLYRFGAQPGRGFWNCQQLAIALTPLVGDDTSGLIEALKAYEPAYQSALADAVLGRFGLVRGDLTDDLALVGDLFAWMTASGISWQGVFHDWFGGTAAEARALDGPNGRLYARTEFQSLRDRLTSREVRPDVDRASEVLAAPCPPNLLIDEIEEIWSKIAEFDDWTGFHEQLRQIRAYGDALNLTPPRGGSVTGSAPG